MSLVPFTQTFVESGTTTAIALVGQVLDNHHTNFVGYDSGSAEYLFTSSVANAKETTLAGNTYYVSAGPAPSNAYVLTTGGSAQPTGSGSASSATATDSSASATDSSASATDSSSSSGPSETGTATTSDSSSTSQSASASPSTKGNAASKLSTGALLTVALGMISVVSLGML